MFGDSVTNSRPLVPGALLLFSLMEAGRFATMIRAPPIALKEFSPRAPRGSIDEYLSF